MVKNVLRAIGGAELYPVISLIIFTLFFAGLLIWVFSLRRGTLDLTLPDGSTETVTAPTPLDRCTSRIAASTRATSSECTLAAL